VLDVVYITTLIAFFAVMVAFVRWCEHIVGKEDVTQVDPTDDADVPGEDGDRPDPDLETASTAKTPEEVPS
jgi:hypothetical protein